VAEGAAGGRGLDVAVAVTDAPEDATEELAAPVDTPAASNELAVATEAHRCAVEFAAEGLTSEAIGPARQAIVGYERCYHDDPETYRPHLAGALNNLAAILGAADRDHEAPPYAQRAVDLYRELATPDRDAYLAMALTNYALRLVAVGREDAALDAAEEAVALRRVLAAADPATHMPRYARLLGTLAGRYDAAGRGFDGVTAETEAVTTLRRLAADDPVEYSHELAMALHRLSLRRASRGQEEPALAAAVEAADILGVLARSDPTQFLPDLGTGLTNLSLRLAQAGRHEEALEPADLAATVYWQLAGTDPERHLDGLADALHQLTIRYLNLARPADAAAWVEKAIPVNRLRVQRGGDATDLARALYDAAVLFADTGDLDRARRYATESAELYDEMGAESGHGRLAEAARRVVATARRIAGLAGAADT
jgi:tetratricopeptide (TPR) repeat protein